MNSVSFGQLLELSLAFLPEEKVRLKALYFRLPQKNQDHIREVFEKEIEERNKILVTADAELIKKLKQIQRGRLGGVLRTIVEEHKKIESQESADIEALLDTL